MENLGRLTNDGFLHAISLSFRAYLAKGTSRSTDKLKPLHGTIARDIASMLGDGYEVCSQGYLADREAAIDGRYISKMVDITIKNRLTGRPVAGIAVKFVMQNYSQNSNNYFENMLGETANIRCAGYPYFQVFIVFDTLPYYNSDKEITKWERFTDHNIAKYLVLSHDNIEALYHTPNKTLIYVVHLPDAPQGVNSLDTYIDFYRYCFAQNNDAITLSENQHVVFGKNVILNDYPKFIDKVYHTILSE